MTKKCKIKLSATDVKDFVRTAEKYDFDIDVFYNRIIIDAKSILGVLSLDLSKNLTVQYHATDSDFEQALQKYVVA
ncbi:MAG: HPr family phosphocarrier protein [Lachnospiraceae bacterium]